MSVRGRRGDESPAPDDGVRVLGDRRWPRGLAKAAARVAAWPRELTPSTELRRWYHGDGGSYEEFRARYEAERAAPAAAELVDRVRDLAERGTVTLLTASKDTGHSHAGVLARLLED
ncbi:DUF488 domain-containing protein [Streptomyces pilosus]